MSSARLRCPKCRCTDLDVHLNLSQRYVWIECQRCQHSAWNSRIAAASALRSDCRRAVPPDQAEYEARQQHFKNLQRMAELQ